MTNEEREKEIRKQPIPTKEECLAFYEETTKLSDVRFVPYYKMAIKALEQTSWIPVSERLPKLYEKVLVTVNTEVSIGWREEDGWRIVDYISLEKYADSWIRGWMPLPGPYKAESEDKE